MRPFVLLVVFLVFLLATPAAAALGVGTTGSIADTSCGTTLVVTPDSTAGDGDLILILGSEDPDSGGDFSNFVISGFTLEATIDEDTAGWNRTRLFSKIAGASEPSSYTITGFVGGPDECIGSIITFTGSHQTDVLPTISTLNDTSANTTFEIPAITTANNDSFDVAFVASGGNDDAGTLSTWGDSLVEDLEENGGDWITQGTAHVVRATAGAQAATEVISSSGDYSVAIRVEVREAAGAPPSGMLFERNNLDGGQNRPQMTGGIP